MTPRPDLVALPGDEKVNIIEQLWDSLAPAERRDGVGVFEDIRGRAGHR